MLACYQAQILNHTNFLQKMHPLVIYYTAHEEVELWMTGNQTNFFYLII